MIHQNPVQPGLAATETVGLPPPTEGVKVEPNGQFVGHAAVATLTTAVGIGTQTAPLLSVAAASLAGATQAVVQNIGTTVVSYRLDGVAPTATVGAQIAAGASIVLNMADAAAALFFGASTASIFVTYTM